MAGTKFAARRAIKAALQALGPATVARIAAHLKAQPNAVAAAIRHANVAERGAFAHVLDWEINEHGMPVRIFKLGPGVDAPQPMGGLRAKPSSRPEVLERLEQASASTPLSPIQHMLVCAYGASILSEAV